MIRYMLIACLLAVAACAAQPPASSPTSSSASGLTTSATTASATPSAAPSLDPFQQWLANTTTADAQAVTKIAALGNPADQFGPACANWLASQANAGAGIHFVKPAGPLSILESAYVGLGALQNGVVTHAVTIDFAKNCGPWLTMIRLRAVGFAAFAAQFGIGK